FEQQHKEQINADQELKDNIKKAWEHIYIAEGSDWCWWYGDDHSSENDADFDKLFRQHLMTVYRCLGATVPDCLHHPIIKADKTLHPGNEITSFINPEINGATSGYYEWHGAVSYDTAQLGGAMHRSEYLVKEIFYGFNLDNFFLRVDVERKILTEDNYHIDINIVNGRQKKVFCEICAMHDAKRLVLICENLNSGKSRQINEETEGEAEIRFAVNSVLELALPFKALALDPNDDLNFSLTVKQQGHEVQRIPASGYLHLVIPDQDFENRMWHV
ncbi:MAG: hypothetical protein KAG92_02745, partial [Deltaproteobacteria bacterium]|nr:hypothetical protein [Deltaproteobacteria bacterium]